MQGSLPFEHYISVLTQWVPGCLGGYILYYLEVLSMGLATNHSSGNNFEVAPRFLEN
jgi:hypothetical protein